MSLRACHVIDLSGPLTKRTLTDEGFLEAPAALSSAGNVQRYRADELGLDDGAIEPTRIFRLYRPDTEVFAPAALKSADNKTLTLGHPPDGVDAANWKEVAVGDVRGIAAAGKHMTGTVTIRDADAIKSMMDGTRQMSCGYDFDLEMTSGTSPSGEAYDGIMTNIRVNHHAIVDVARGGPGCRIADHKQGDRTMALKVIDRGKLSVEIEAAQAQIVGAMLADADGATKAATDVATAATKRATDAEAALAALTKTNADLVGAHDTEVKALKAKIPTDDQMLAATEERAALILDGKTLAPDLEIKGKTTKAVRAAIVAAVLAGDSEPLKKTAESILKATGEADPAKASDEALKATVAALIVAKGDDASAGDDHVDDQETTDRDKRMAGAGDGGGRDSKKLVGRELEMQRDWLTSRGRKEDAAKLGC